MDFGIPTFVTDETADQGQLAVPVEEARFRGSGRRPWSDPILGSGGETGAQQTRRRVGLFSLPGSCYRKCRRLIASMATLIAAIPTLAHHKMAGSGPHEQRVCGRLTKSELALLGRPRHSGAVMSPG